MATAKREVETVKMFGTGNFIIGDTLYAFRDGETIECKHEHKDRLIVEAKRRETVSNAIATLTSQMEV